MLALPTDLPVPGGDGNPRHGAATEKVVLELAQITDGGIFVLFTSYRALRLLASALRSAGADRRWPILVHGAAPRQQLVEQFVASRRASLLGTDSFWEGVAVPGHPLRGIVSPTLPFRVPTEPITEARSEAIEKRGGNAFNTYMLPHAAIKLKQGFGRLIRSRIDTGAVVVLDSRIVTKSYGRYLLESLPPARVVTGTWAACKDELGSFYARGPHGRDPDPSPAPALSPG
jgi:ATP-dependent DNA helicase DinG